MISLRHLALGILANYQKMLRRTGKPLRDPDDLVQDMLLAAHKAQKAFDPQRILSSRPYYALVMAKVAYNRVRKRQSPEVPFGDQSLVASKDESLKPAKWDASRWEQILSVLPEDLRRVMIMRYRDGLDRKRVGEALSLSPKQLRTLESRALRQLRDEFHDRSRI